MCFSKYTTPSAISGAAAKELLSGMVAELISLGKTEAMEVKSERILKFMACRGAIKAGDKLSRIEMDQLIRDLYKTQNPLTCPQTYARVNRIVR